MIYLIKIDFIIRSKRNLFFVLFISSMALGQSNQKLLIDPRYVKGGTVSEFVDEVTFIPLETTKESTFGIAQKVQISREHFAFYDPTTKTIFIFYKNGKFRSKIKELPELNAEAISQFSSLKNFTLDSYSEKIYIVYDMGNPTHSKHLAVFNLDGKLHQSIALNKSFDNLSPSFVFLDSTTTLFTNERGKPHSQYSFHIVTKFETIIASKVKIDPSDPFNKSWANNFSLQSSTTHGSLWNRLYDTEILTFDGNGLLGSYKILLPLAITLDSAFYKDSAIFGNGNKSNEYLSEHRDKISYLVNFQKISNWLSFSFVRFNMSGPKDVYLFNLERKDLYSLGGISPDSLCYSIPLFTAGALVVGAEEDYLYVSIPSFSLYNVIKNLTDKQWETNPVLSNYFKTQNQKSNPVLVRLKLKKSFG